MYVGKSVHSYTGTLLMLAGQANQYSRLCCRPFVFYLEHTNQDVSTPMYTYTYTCTVLYCTMLCVYCYVPRLPKAIALLVRKRLTLHAGTLTATWHALESFSSDGSTTRVSYIQDSQTLCKSISILLGCICMWCGSCLVNAVII